MKRVRKKDKMRANFKKKKKVTDNFCVAYLKLVSDELFAQCFHKNGHISCFDCLYNHRMRRAIE